ncbi:uncharacterized protein LOC128682914 isoform X3 [Plodia interpunctella]|uniref:uncharacterized protein LOC128682914 isoform X3 n=1 Tax=Plodia interpunctella TaxID=58824 RepID=UPI002368E92A|nr:uncharacterized protein LOC128682914 isoform X3 [Plodia interpunctella]
MKFAAFNMFGVFIRKWKPKRTSNNERDESPCTDGNVSPEPPDRPPGKVRQIHPAEKPQMLAYDSSYRRKSKPNVLPLEENHYNHLANTNVAMTPLYPLTPNICVEGGKIEFIKSPPSSARNSLAMVSPPQTPLLARRGSRDKRDARIYDEPAEKSDEDKELLEKRIKQLEAQLEEEKRRTQKEKMAVTKLQNKLIKREGAARSDAERERRARSDWEARARAAEADAARLAGKLHAAQREIARMEETVRSLLQYKSRVETLKQEKASLSSALEASASHYQSQLSSLSAENERLRGQLSALSAGLGGDHERRLDDVAQQVVRALLSQKSVREELGCARARVRELEAQNRALSALLVRQLRPQPRPSPATPHTPLTPHTPRDLQVHLVDVGSCGSLVSFRDSPPPAPPVQHPHPLSQDDKRRHQILADIWTELKGLEVTPANLARALSAVDPTLWAAPARPATLSLNMPQPCTDPVRGTDGEKVTEEETGEQGEAGAESPESGAKDEGYSTMSSDVQADASRQSDHAADRALPDLNEASDETDNQTIVSINPRESRRHARLMADADYIYFPIGVAFAGVRGSYPPSRPVLPFQHVVRSFSDSHLCLKLLAGTTCPTSCLDSPTPSSGVLVLDLKPAPERPLRRPAIASTTSSERVSWGSTADERADGSQYDADYVQHWLELDDARSALQQRHRDIADLEYDRAELEDWSLSLSCEDLRDRQSPFAEIATPGQISLSTLPSIREDDALELEEDVGDCLWNDCGFATVEIDECRIDDANTSDKRWECSGTQSPGGSWSSTQSDVPDKRSSTALSEDGDCANIGVDFTRDFYRLVKYESTKSLASNSSRGIPAPDLMPGNNLRVHDVQAMALQDREQALQNVLHFIAEQQKYCRDREESDSVSSRPVSEIRELPPPYAAADFDDDSVGPRSEVSEDRLRPDSFGSFSENESCDVIPVDRLKHIHCDTVSEPRSTPRFIEREDPYAESGDYFDDMLRLENTENEIDEHHHLKVQRKNEINKSIDVSISVDEDLSAPQIKEEKSDTDSSRNVEHNSALKENIVNIMLNKQGVVNERVEIETALTKSTSFTFPSVDTEMSLVDEVLSACRRSTVALVTVPEEEENSSPETGSPQMTESNTTSTSTAETVIVSNKNEAAQKEIRPKSEKSRIPTLMGGKRPPSSPNKVRSKIPVAGKLRPETTVTVPEPIIVKQDQTLSFHEAATSKDVIEELNRMIRQNDATSSAGAEQRAAPAPAQRDAALWAPTGWVHVEKDIDFSDPKARANLLDVMLASSDSSPSSCGSSPAEPPPPYSRLHRLHRSRRQKTAAAHSRAPGALRAARARPSVLQRADVFVRFGDAERAALAAFRFLDDLSCSSPDTKDC